MSTFLVCGHNLVVSLGPMVRQVLGRAGRTDVPRQQFFDSVNLVISDRTKGAATLVLPYDASKGGAQYCLKFMDDPAWDWSEHNLELMSPNRPRSFATKSKMRKKWRRHQERLGRCNGRKS